MEFGFNPGMWASPIPFGLGEDKPKHFRDMARIWWTNRDQLEYATRILKEGVCDGCALGTTGIRDYTLEGVHLCTIRLELLRLNTMGPLDAELLRDVGRLERETGSAEALRELGRIPHPMIRRRGDAGFERISWDAALELVAAKKQADLDRILRTFEGTDVQILKGRWGPFITDGKKNARMPKEREPDSMTLEECQAALDAAPDKRGRKKAAKKKTARKKTGRKKAAKKKTIRKKAARKAAAGTAGE